MAMAKALTECVAELEFNAEPSFDDVAIETEHSRTVQTANDCAGDLYHFVVAALADGFKAQCGENKNGVDSVSDTRYVAILLYAKCDRIAALCRALVHSKTVLRLWLKRDSLGVEGAKCVAVMLLTNSNMRTLDLVSTGMGEQGLCLLIEARASNTAFRILWVAPQMPFYYTITARRRQRIVRRRQHFNLSALFGGSEKSEQRKKIKNMIKEVIKIKNMQVGCDDKARVPLGLYI